MIKLLRGALALALLSSPVSAMSGVSTSTLQGDAQTAATVACLVADGANATLSVEDAINQGKATQAVRTGTTGAVVNASAAICAQLGGIAQNLSAPAGTPAVAASAN